MAWRWLLLGGPCGRVPPLRTFPVPIEGREELAGRLHSKSTEIPFV